jgi:hypothetical protein
MSHALAPQIWRYPALHHRWWWYGLVAAVVLGVLFWCTPTH